MKKILILLLFLISLNFVYAADINVKNIPVKAVILPGQNAIFDLEITNAQTSSDEIKVVILDSNWQSKAGTDMFEISAGKKATERLTLFPLGFLNSGVYAINLRLISTKDSSVFTDHQLVVTVVGYKELLETSIETNPQGIDPRKENLVKLVVRPRYNIDLELVNIHLENSLFTRDISTSINGLQDFEDEFTVKLDPNTKEGNYNTKILVKYNNEILVDGIEELKVFSYADIKDTVTEETKFLVKEKTLNRINNGNSDSSEVFTTTLSGFKKLFTKFDPQPTGVEKTDEGYVYEWRFVLQPKENYTIKVSTNYRTPLLWLLIIVLAAYLSYKYLRIELFMHKKVLSLKTHEGGLAGVKVLLHIKNNGATVKNLHIMDNIPNDLEIPHEYMTLKPTSIRKGMTGATIIWEIPELLKGEERVISYKLKPKTMNVNRLVFTKAICRYKNSLGKLSVSRSNEVTVYA